MEFMDEILDLNFFRKHKKICKKKLYKIYEVIDINTNELYTAQIQLKEINTFTKEELIDYCNDINTISKLNHPSIINFVGYSPVDFKDKSRPVVITENSTNNTLASIIKLESEVNQKWNDTKKLINIYGIASAMSYLHMHNIIHCDLTSESILMDQNLYPKLQNFNYSKEIAGNSTVLNERLNRSKLYLAPEVIKNNECSKKSDVYGFSLIVYEIITSQRPFKQIENKLELVESVVNDGLRPSINESIPKCYHDLIEKCWSQNPEERPNFDQLLITLENCPDFLTGTVDKEEFKNYIRMIKESPLTFDSTHPIIRVEELIEEIERKRRSETIENLISSKDAEKLIDFLNTECDEETTSSVFDRCLKESSDFFQILCKEGILLNNAIAHHKFASFLLFEKDDIDSSTLKQAKEHLVESIKLGFSCSYFVLARLFFEFFDERNLAFGFASKGAELGEKYSKCLLGFFTAHGVGTKKDHKKGVKMMLESGADVLYQLFATDIGIHYINETRKKQTTAIGRNKEETDEREANENATKQEVFDDEHKRAKQVNKNVNFAVEKEESVDGGIDEIVEEEEEVESDEENIKNDAEPPVKDKQPADGDQADFTDSESQALIECEYDEFIEYEYDESIDDYLAFKWFEKAYNMNKTKATINNYGLCFLHGIGTQKDIQKAKEIFQNGAEKGDPNSLYHLGFILEETDPVESLKSYESAALKGHINAKSKLASYKLNSNQTESLKKSKRINNFKGSKSQSSLALLVDEINTNHLDELYKKEAKRGNQDAMQILTVKYSQDNDTENAYNYIEKLIKAGNCSIPIEYVINLYKMKQFNQAFNYFCMMSKINNPIAKYYIGVMKYRGEGCVKNVDEAYQILKNLSDNGIDRASDFIEDNF